MHAFVDSHVTKSKYMDKGFVSGLTNLTAAVSFDSRKFRGHFPSSVSSTGGGGGFHRTKYGRRTYAPPKKESVTNGQTGTLPFELQSRDQIYRSR